MVLQVTNLQKASAQAIVNIFETGSIRGDYGDVTYVSGDAGQLTYGRSQTTLASGNLFLLINDYVARPEGSFGEPLRPYLPFLEARDYALNHDLHLRQTLRDAGGDLVMRETQDSFFDRVYWEPAFRSADKLGVETALGAAIVYDSTVHGSWARLRDTTRRKHGELKAIGETKWMQAYVTERRQWLANHGMRILHKTVYRMDAFNLLIRNGNWKLALAFSVRGHLITEAALGASDAVPMPTEPVPRRLLRLRQPQMSGDDIKWAQERLNQGGVPVPVNGVFDLPTDSAVRAFQEKLKLKVDGIIGPVTRGALEDLALSVPPAAIPEDASAMPAVPEPQPSAPPPPPPPASEPQAPPPPEPPAAPSAPAASASVISGQRRGNSWGLRVASVAAKGRPVLATVVGGGSIGIAEARDAVLRFVHGGAQPETPRDPSSWWPMISDTLIQAREVATFLPDDGAFFMRMAAAGFAIYGACLLSIRLFTPNAAH